MQILCGLIWGLISTFAHSYCGQAIFPKAAADRLMRSVHECIPVSWSWFGDGHQPSRQGQGASGASSTQMPNRHSV